MRANFFLVFLLALETAQPEFRDLSLAAANVADIFGYGRTQLRICSLQFQQAIARHIALIGQITHAIELLFQELKLQFLAIARLFQALVLQHQTRDIFIKRRQLALDGGLPRAEQLLLQADVVGDARIALDPFEFGWKNNGLFSIALSNQARLRGTGGEVLDACYFRVDCCLDRIHADHNVARLHHITFLDQNGLYRTPRHVLNGLFVGGDGDRSAQRNPLVQGRKRRPQQEAPHPRDDDPPAQAGM